MVIPESLKRWIPLSLRRRLGILLDYIQHEIQSPKRNPIKEFRIKRSQERLLKENYSPDVKKLIVFLVQGGDIINGGAISISSIYDESAKLKHIHGAEVIMCTAPGQPLVLKYTKFKNNNYIFRYPRILYYFQELQSLMIHIAEPWIEPFVKSCSRTDLSRLHRVKDFRFNILLQNIDYLSPMKYVEELKRLGPLTCTTAHASYSTPEMSKKLGCPLHKLMAYGSPELYNRKQYIEKENLMIVSPDIHPQKAKILSLITRQFPKLRIQIIQNLSYEEFKNVISRAKWALTFGEGLDGYFLETIFSGGISFAAYNTKYFTEDFKSLRTVYGSYDILAERIYADIEELDNEMAYTDYQNKQYELCCKYYDHKKYVNNLELFYKGQYTYK